MSENVDKTGKSVDKCGVLADDYIKGRRVFLSGPMTGREDYNAEAFAAAHALLRRLGAKHVYDPAYEWLTRPDVDGQDHEACMRRSVCELAHADPYTRKPYYDVLVSLEGWFSSEGATLERNVAEACGIEVVDVVCLVALEELG